MILLERHNKLALGRKPPEIGTSCLRFAIFIALKKVLKSLVPTSFLLLLVRHLLLEAMHLFLVASLLLLVRHLLLEAMHLFLVASLLLLVRHLLLEAMHLFLVASLLLLVRHLLLEAMHLFLVASLLLLVRHLLLEAMHLFLVASLLLLVRHLLHLVTCNLRRSKRERFFPSIGTRSSAAWLRELVPLAVLLIDLDLTSSLVAHTRRLG